MRLSFQDVFLRTSSEKERLLKVFRKNCGGKTVKHLFSTYIFYTMCGCRTLLKEALGSRTLWRFKSVLSCLGASSSCQIAVPELLGVQGLHQVVLLAVASVPYQSPLSYAQLAHVGVFCDRLGFGPPTLDDVTYWQPQYPHLALGFWQRVHTGVEKGPLGCTPCNQPPTKG